MTGIRKIIKPRFKEWAKGMCSDGDSAKTRRRGVGGGGVGTEGAKTVLQSGNGSSPPAPASSWAFLCAPHPL